MSEQTYSVAVMSTDGRAITINEVIDHWSNSEWVAVKTRDVTYLYATRLVSNWVVGKNDEEVE